MEKIRRQLDQQIKSQSPLQQLCNEGILFSRGELEVRKAEGRKKLSAARVHGASVWARKIRGLYPTQVVVEELNADETADLKEEIEASAIIGKVKNIKGEGIYDPDQEFPARANYLYTLLKFAGMDIPDNKLPKLVEIIRLAYENKPDDLNMTPYELKQFETRRREKVLGPLARLVNRGRVISDEQLEIIRGALEIGDSRVRLSKVKQQDVGAPMITLGSSEGVGDSKKPA
ncbi:MAG: hypothetical protein Q8P26_01380 [Candidatus Levybacteria bacterium]|nr:hypothetical protein [Candidatus Levybacteria bacterium]